MNSEKDMHQPMMVSSHDIHLDTDYAEWIAEVKHYNNIRIKDMLPTQEQLKERMELLRKEMQATKRLMKKSEGEE